MNKLVVWLALGIFSTSSFAGKQESLDKQLYNAEFTLSAFDCSVVSADKKLSSALFSAGMDSGRSFIAFVKENPEQYLATIKTKVPMLWNWLGGPSADFMLGQLYEKRVSEIYKEFETDSELWELKKANIFRQNNCSVLLKPQA